MLEIVICDISEQQRKILKQIVQMLCFEYKINANFHGYNSYKALIEDVEEGYITIDVLFLEINLGLANGLDVARKLRNLKSKAQIVLQANTEKYAIAGYDIGATGYILKPYKQDKVTTIVKRLLLQQKKRRIAFKSMRKDIFVAVDDIMYIESNKHSILVHLSDGREIHTYGKLGDIEKIINDKNFLRCSQSYLVNMNYIIDITDNFIPADNSAVPIRVRGRKGVIDHYVKHFKGCPITDKYSIIE